MAPKRPAEEATAAGAGSVSEGSDADAEAEAARGHGSSPSPSKTPPPANPNPKSSTAAPPSAAGPVSGAGFDSGAASDSDADTRGGGASRRGASSPRAGNPGRPRSVEVNSDSENAALPVASDAYADPAAGADSDDGNASPPPPPPPRPSRAEAAAIKPISSRPMDPPPRRSAGASEPRAKRPRSAAVASSAEHSKRPSRVWSQADELVILRGLITYRTKRGVLPGSTQDIDKLHSYIRSQLSVKVSTTQLSDKVRRLKQKYQLLATRAKTGREEFPTPHDHNIYEFAKKVWGTMSTAAADGGGSGYDNADGGESEEERYGRESDDDMEGGRDNRHRKNQRSMPVTMANGNGIGIGAVNATVRGRAEFEKGKDVYPYLWETVEELSSQHPSGAVFKKAFELLEGSKAQVMEEKLQKFRLTEMRQQLCRMDLMKDTISMVLDALEMAD